MATAYKLAILVTLALSIMALSLVLIGSISLAVVDIKVGLSTFILAGITDVSADFVLTVVKLLVTSFLFAAFLLSLKFCKRQSDVFCVTHCPVFTNAVE